MIGIIKCIIQWWVQIRWKSAKNSPKMVIGRKCLHSVTKVQNSIFLSLFLDIFSQEFLATFSTDSKSASNSSFFIPILFFWEFFFILLELFQTLNANADETAKKKRKNFSYKRVLELNFCNNQWPGRTKLLKPLHPTVHLPFLIKFATPFVAFRARILISQEYLFLKNFIPSCILFIFQPVIVLLKSNQLYFRWICSAPCKMEEKAWIYCTCMSGPEQGLRYVSAHDF